MISTLCKYLGYATFQGNPEIFEKFCFFILSHLFNFQFDVTSISCITICHDIFYVKMLYLNSINKYNACLANLMGLH